jgi:hypothetical protein
LGNDEICSGRRCIQIWRCCHHPAEDGSPSSNNKGMPTCPDFFINGESLGTLLWRSWRRCCGAGHGNGRKGNEDDIEVRSQCDCYVDHSITSVQCWGGGTGCGCCCSITCSSLWARLRVDMPPLYPRPPSASRGVCWRPGWHNSGGGWVRNRSC